MKKKILVVSLLAVVAAGVLIGCGRKNNDETGSNTDSGNHVTESSSEGMFQEVMTEAATDIKEGATEIKDGIKDAATEVATKAGEAMTKMGEAIEDIVR